MSHVGGYNPQIFLLASLAVIFVPPLLIYDATHANQYYTQNYYSVCLVF